MLLHAAFLVVLNLFSQNFYVIASHIVSIHSGPIIQSVLTMLINVAIYAGVFHLMSVIDKEIMTIADFSMLAIIWLSSMALLPVFYYPLHYSISGSWNNFDFFLEFWPYQLIVNGLCLVMNFFIIKRIS